MQDDSEAVLNLPDGLLSPDYRWSHPISIQTSLVSAIALTFVLTAAAGRADDIDLLDSEATESGSPMSSDKSCMPAAAAAAVEVALTVEQASAGIMYNLAEHPLSIRAVVKKMLSAAVAASVQPHAASCTLGCASTQVPQVVFRVSPVMFLPAAEQQPLCLRLAEETARRPLQFGRRDFATTAKLDEWIMQFSQGNGPDGKLLYQQCGGNCDPVYTFVIAQHESGLQVESEVYCGFTRDRKNNMFTISTALRAHCGVPPR